MIALTIVDFILFPDIDRPISRYQIREAQTDRLCSDHLEWIFAELPKLENKPTHLQTEVERWLYFIREAGILDAMPTPLDNPELEEAFEIANEAQLSREEFELSEKQRLKLLDEEGRVNYALREGLQQGIEQLSLIHI